MSSQSPDPGPWAGDKERMFDQSAGFSLFPVSLSSDVHVPCSIYPGAFCGGGNLRDARGTGNSFRFCSAREPERERERERERCRGKAWTQRNARGSHQPTFEYLLLPIIPRADQVCHVLGDSRREDAAVAHDPAFQGPMVSRLTKVTGDSNDVSLEGVLHAVDLFLCPNPLFSSFLPCDRMSISLLVILISLFSPLFWVISSRLTHLGNGKRMSESAQVASDVRTEWLRSGFGVASE